MMIAPFLEKLLHLNSLKELGEGQRFFLSLLFLKNNHLKIIYPPKGTLGWQSLLLSITFLNVCSGELY